MRKPTQSMIAKEAGVSIATVSMVLNETGNISEDTRNQVKEIANQLGYRRRRPGNGTIGVTGDIPEGLVSALLQAAAEYGYGLHRFTFPDPKTADLRFTLRCAGTIVHGGHWHPRLLAALSQAYPTVLMGGSIPDTQVDSVWVDSSEGISLATNYLLARGHRTLGLINGPTASITSWEKSIGFERVLCSQSHLNPKGLIVKATEYRKEAGKEAARQLLAQLPDVTGIIASEVGFALGVLELVQELHMRVPHDISLVVFHDSPRLQNTTPPLTVIGLPEMAIAREVVLHLVRRIQDPHANGRRLLLKPTLVERASVATIG